MALPAPAKASLSDLPAGLAAVEPAGDACRAASAPPAPAVEDWRALYGATTPAGWSTGDVCGTGLTTGAPETTAMATTVATASPARDASPGLDAAAWPVRWAHNPKRRRTPLRGKAATPAMAPAATRLYASRSRSR